MRVDVSLFAKIAIFPEIVRNCVDKRDENKEKTTKLDELDLIGRFPGFIYANRVFQSPFTIYISSHHFFFLYFARCGGRNKVINKLCRGTSFCSLQPKRKCNRFVLDCAHVQHVVCVTSVAHKFGSWLQDSTTTTK